MRSVPMSPCSGLMKVILSLILFTPAAAVWAWPPLLMCIKPVQRHGCAARNGPSLSKCWALSVRPLRVISALNMQQKSSWICPSLDKNVEQTRNHLSDLHGYYGIRNCSEPVFKTYLQGGPKKTGISKNMAITTLKSIRKGKNWCVLENSA